MAAVAVTSAPLDLQALIEEVGGTSTTDGAVASFIGLVREQNQGRRVSFLEYEAYEPLAIRALQLITEEALASWADTRVGVHHRIYLEKAGVSAARPTVAYCRIGERSSHTWFVLKYLLGLPDVRNYDGSWTEYGSMVGLPIERECINFVVVLWYKPWPPFSTTQRFGSPSPFQFPAPSPLFQFLAAMFERRQ